MINIKHTAFKKRIKIATEIFELILNIMVTWDFSEKK